MSKTTNKNPSRSFLKNRKTESDPRILRNLPTMNLHSVLSGGSLHATAACQDKRLATR
ncbi:hypothetical protein THTE_3503 [Thermogutta terrifontis]|uniref:Uncharacterized protein n=1 Tax=Thermogutta terrifontis TaxID=1331910 RepID=A0A286RJG5_9BACT|nr:hypothetical protein THTE_3503 [Thermogutta terrifontis]